MKNIGLDVKLLKIGLQYAQLRATGGNFLQLFSSQDNVKLEVDPSNYQNLTYLHAMVLDPQAPKVHLKSVNLDEVLEYDEIKEKFTNSINTNGNAGSIDVLQNQGLTNLDLLCAVVPFTIADATCDISYHRSHMAENIEAFGLKGADNVAAFILNELNEYHTKNLAAYKLEEPFVTNLNELKVTLGFECIVRGYEGRGTDNVYVNSDRLLTKIDAIRH